MAKAAAKKAAKAQAAAKSTYQPLIASRVLWYARVGRNPRDHGPRVGYARFFYTPFVGTTKACASLSRLGQAAALLVLDLADSQFIAV